MSRSCQKAPGSRAPPRRSRAAPAPAPTRSRAARGSSCGAWRKSPSGPSRTPPPPRAPRCAPGAAARRDLVEGRGDQRQHRHQVRVAVALHHLGGGGLEAEAEPRADRLLEVGRQVGEGADGARDLADAGLVERAVQAHAVALASPARKHQQLEPEGGGLGVHAVGAADARGVRNSSARRRSAVHAGTTPARSRSVRRRGSGAPAPCRGRRSTSCRSGSSATRGPRSRPRSSGRRSRRGAPRASISATRAGSTPGLRPDRVRAHPFGITPRSRQLLAHGELDLEPARGTCPPRTRSRPSRARV